MLKVFLVEDDDIVRAELRDGIPWQQWGYRFAGEAADGEMALPLIRKLQPDVLLTDITMPFMDGLSLSRIVHQQFPEMKILIISGRDDFEYAQQAIAVGVEQYLLKPVARDDLQRVLAQLKAKIDAEREQRERQKNYQIETREYEQFARTNFFMKLFEGRMAVEDIYAEAARLSLNVNAPCYNILLYNVHEKKPAESGGPASETLARRREELLHYFIRYPELLIFRWNLNTYGVLIMGSAEQMKELAARCLDNVERICRPAENELDWHAAAGEPVERLSMLSECYDKVNRLFAYRFLMPGEHILTWEATEKYMPFQAGGRIGDIDAAQVAPELIRDFLRQGSRDEIPEFVDGWLQKLEDAVRSGIFRNYLFYHVYFVAAAYVESLGCGRQELQELFSGEGTAPERGPDGGELSVCIERMLDKAMELRDRASDSQGRKALNRALEYIEEHYMQETLSLHTAAADVGVSAGYLSALFSRTMEMTFIEYVTHRRMERAKELLRRTDRASGDIAQEVGYKDPHYFSYVFKKTQGCTPREYRAGAKG